MPTPPERREPVADKAIGSLENGKVGNLSKPERNSNINRLQVPPMCRRLHCRASRQQYGLARRTRDCVIVLAAAGFIIVAVAGLLP